VNIRSGSGAVYRHFYNWFLWKVFAPFCLLAFIWFAYALKGDIPQPFASAFAHGELLIFAAVLLIEVSIEGEEVRGVPDHQFDWWFDGALPALRFLALVILFGFGFIRYQVLSLSLQADKSGSPAEEPIRNILFAYAALNVAIAGTAVAVAAFSCFKHSHHEFHTRFEALRK
jgi:hypothetical protein